MKVPREELRAAGEVSRRRDALPLGPTQSGGSQGDRRSERDPCHFGRCVGVGIVRVPLYIICKWNHSCSREPGGKVQTQLRFFKSAAALSRSVVGAKRRVEQTAGLAARDSSSLLREDVKRRYIHGYLPLDSPWGRGISGAPCAALQGSSCYVPGSGMQHAVMNPCSFQTCTHL